MMLYLYIDACLYVIDAWDIPKGLRLDKTFFFALIHFYDPVNILYIVCNSTIISFHFSI